MRLFGLCVGNFKPERNWCHKCYRRDKCKLKTFNLIRPFPDSTYTREKTDSKDEYDIRLIAYYYYDEYQRSESIERTVRGESPMEVVKNSIEFFVEGRSYPSRVEGELISVDAKKKFRFLLKDEELSLYES